MKIYTRPVHYCFFYLSSQPTKLLHLVCRLRKVFNDYKRRKLLNSTRNLWGSTNKMILIILFLNECILNESIRLAAIARTTESRTTEKNVLSSWHPFRIIYRNKLLIQKLWEITLPSDILPYKPKSEEKKKTAGR